MDVLNRARYVALTIVAAILAACASGPEIRSDASPQADFSRYRTFAYFSPLATDKAGYETVFTARLKDSTRRALEARGYVYSADEPDLLVNFYANVEDKQQIRSTPGSMGYYSYRRGYYTGFSSPSVETVDYKVGTLTIDLVDARRKALAWQATAEGRVSRAARENPGPAIDKAVIEMLAALPAAGKPAD